MDTLLAALLLLLPLIDAQNLFAPLRRVLVPAASPSDDFTIVVPLYGSPAYFRNRDFLEPLRENVLLAVDPDTPAMERFVAERRAEGWRVAVVPTPATARPVGMLAQALNYVTTTYVMRLDGDARAELHPGCAVAAAAADEADLCSVKVRVHRPRTVAEHMQAVEYDVSMLGRHHTPWLISGACHLARVDAMRRILAQHTQLFTGEDVETGRIAKYLGMRVRHVDYEVTTEAPATWRSLFRQRASWWSGSVRTAIVNGDKNLRYPIFLAYNLVLVWLLLSGKILSGLTAMTVVPTVLLAYTAMTVLCSWRYRSRWMILFPYYAGAQALVMPAVGVWRYARDVLATDRLGRYRIGIVRPGEGRRALGRATQRHDRSAA